jgi:hypothetical protein
MNSPKKIIVIGGGAAGFFFAINCAEKNPNYDITILEKSPKILEKVRISGGGRCNVTHACFDPRALVKFYPRGEKELLGPFHHFSPKQTIEWFEKRGVKLKTEADGRMFPTTDNSETIIDCFLSETKRLGIKIKTLIGVENLIPTENNQWQIVTNRDESIVADAVFIASGSATRMWNILEKLNYKIEPPVPSLFTFNIKDERIKDLMGVSVNNAEVKVAGSKLTAQGPLLITHWGMSGPAILKLSAWGACELHKQQHQFQILVKWASDFDLPKMIAELKNYKQENPKRMVASNNLFQIPMRLWKSLILYCAISETENWATVSSQKLDALAKELTQGLYTVKGKSTNKEEFVTCGGVALNQIDFKSMQSKLHPNLFFGGEVLNIDAVTGGFNFQAAWTEAWIASQNL